MVEQNFQVNPVGSSKNNKNYIKKYFFFLHMAKIPKVI